MPGDNLPETTGLRCGDVVDYVGPPGLVPKADMGGIGRGYVIQEIRDTPHGPGVILVGGGGIWLASAFRRREPGRPIHV